MGNEASSRVASGKHGHTLISDAKFRRLYGLALEHAQQHEDMAAAMAGIAADLRGDDVVVTEEREGNFGERVIAAIGNAACDRLRKNGRLTVIVCANAGTDAIVREAHQLADDAKLPVIFVEDWRQAGNGEAKKKGSAPLPQRIGAMPAIPVDAGDVIAIYRVAHESMARAREGSGPTRVLCVRWAATDNNGDAVGHLEQWLEARGLPAQTWRREILAELRTAMQSTASETAVADEIEELRLA